MHINTKGQVTIPLNIRERLGFLPNTDIDFIEQNDRVVLIKKNSVRRGDVMIEALRNKGDVPLSTDEIMAFMRG